MTRRAASGKAEVLKPRSKELQLREVLEILVDLLEQYSPMWYTEEHRKQARAALDRFKKGIGNR